ncbi:DnaJ domain protein, partial [Opisthorchis viverrini]
LQVSRDDDRAFIRKSYRKLAREHHPDRQQTPSAKAEAELHLRKLNIAYEILMDEEQRRDYDYMLDNPEETYFHYYRYYRHRYSPKIDVRIVIAIIVTVLCVIQYIGQWTSYNHALTYLARDPKHRAKAREIASADGLLSVRRKDNGARFTREELKDREEAILRDIISRTVDLRLLLGVTASVAAIKTPLLVEQLTQLGFEVRVIATENSLKFFDPNDLSVRVFRDLEEWSTWSKRGDPILHI